MAISASPTASFAEYFARFLIVRRGYSFGFVDEAERLVACCDIILTRLDPLDFRIACIVDAEQRPGKAFTADPSLVLSVAAACRKHAGRIRGVGKPVLIEIFEIGPGATTKERCRRLSDYRGAGVFAKARMLGWAVDPAAKRVWLNRARLRWMGRERWLQRVVAGPRLSEAELAAVDVAPVKPALVKPAAVEAAAAPGGWPFCTIGLIVVLLAVFAAETLLAIDPTTGALRASIRTLLAFGGLNRALVLEQGQAWRLATAPFLHADLWHLLCDCFALGLLGWRAERLIGSAWFAAIFACSALAASLTSLALNPAMTLIGVGASGGIVGLYAAALVLSLRYPPGAIRLRLILLGLVALVPAVAGMLLSRDGAPIDYGAGGGGAIGGGLMGLALLRLWPRANPRPYFRTAAASIAACMVLAGAVAIWPALGNYRRIAASLELYDPWPGSEAEARAQSAAMVAAKPRDPRARFVHALVLIAGKDIAGAEHDLRVALNQTDVLESLGNPTFEARVRALLAAVLIDQGKPDEAKLIARPACASEASGPVRNTLDQFKLCG